jgi:hypothetical protein
MMFGGGWGRKEEVVMGSVDSGCVQIQSSVARQRHNGCVDRVTV